jgi:hypothetical protein
MTRLVDIVNFNADASCLDSQKWLSCLSGGSDSQFCKWLFLYVRHRKLMALGMTGTTISDLKMYNPEAIAIVKNNPDIFQVILRPYSHDIALLRTPQGFRFNLAAGIAVMKATFESASLYYLPPEFMMTNEQIHILSNLGIKATFVNSSRYPVDLAARIPDKAYFVKGILGSMLGCIPVNGNLTQLYLRSIQLFDTDEWNKTIASVGHHCYLWRDGESPFLIPDGIEREDFWLANCHAERMHLGEEEYSDVINTGMYQSYPIHSFLEWMKEFRMIGYLNRIEEIEKHLSQLHMIAKCIWLLTINSDILSSVEKKSPLIRLRLLENREQIQQFQILRSERAFEGEEYLALLQRCMTDEKYPCELINPTEAHLKKAKGRIEHLKSLEPTWQNAMHCS